MTNACFIIQDLLEKALQGLMRQQDGRRDPYELDSIHKQQRTVEKELSRVLYKLAEASKVGLLDVKILF